MRFKTGVLIPASPEIVGSVSQFGVESAYVQHKVNFARPKSYPPSKRTGIAKATAHAAMQRHNVHISGGWYK